MQFYEDKGENMANVRLVASAPKMYWLLNEMLKNEALKAQCKTEEDAPVFMKALVAQHGVNRMAR